MTKTVTMRVGAPKKSPEQRQTERIMIRLTPADAAEVQRRGGSAWVRQVVLGIIRGLLRE